MTPLTDALNERRSSLSESKRDLLEKRLRGAAPSTTGSGSRILPRPQRDEAPLSSAQQRMWFFGELDAGSAVYHIPYALRLKGPLDVAALRAALDRIAARHDILRTRFLAIGDGPSQVIPPTHAVPFREVDLSAESDAETRLEHQLVEESRRPFDLTRKAPVRVTLFTLGENDHALAVVMHHIASDLSSWQIFLRELRDLYAGFSQGCPVELPPLPLQYGDYAAWERKHTDSAQTAGSLAYWKKKLAGAPPWLELPTDHARPAMMTFNGALARRKLPRHLVEELHDLSRREGTTLFMTLLAAFDVLLHRITQQNDLIVGVPTAGRTQAQVENLIGLFVNTVPLRATLADDPAFKAFLQQVKATTLEALSHQDLPFDKLIEELRPTRDPGHLPLAQVMFTLQSTMSEGAELRGLDVQAIDFDPGTSRFELTLVAEQTPHGLDLVLEYNTDLFAAQTADRLLGNFHTLLDGIVADPTQQVSALPILTAAEREQLLVTWNATRLDYPRDYGLHQLFEAQAIAQPEKVALVCGEQRLTYRELDERATGVAERLRALGVDRETRVAIFLTRDVPMIVAILGTLKAGGAYVPMDPAYPADRLAFMIEDCGAVVAITEKKTQGALPKTAAKVVVIDELDSTHGREKSARYLSSARTEGSDLAYVIYTSGSTGRPKGVAIEHRNAVAFVRWAETVFSARELDGVLAGTSVCFDLSIFEIFVPLSRGGKIILAENPLALPELATAREVRLLNTVPSVMSEVLRAGIPTSVETINLAGEPLPQSLVDQLYALPHIKRVNDLYGPTETTTYSTWTTRTANARPTIGRPLANTELYVLDAHRKPVPIGATGELYIGGAGVARGYLNRPELTAERFIANPFSLDPHSRLYRTGDLCRYRADGNVEYLGRADQQVKIRGFRIEPGEVETALRKHPGVADATVIAREDIAGERRLVAYFTCEPDRDAPADLREFLQQSLPRSMIPSAFVRLEALPRTANGKIDRKALPAPEAEAASGRGHVGPRNDLEAKLVAVWETVLNVRPISVTDHFFDLGGHSLLAVRLVGQMERALDRKLPVASLFQAPSVAQFAAMLVESKADGYAALFGIQPNGSRQPLFLAHGMGGGSIWGYMNLSRELGEDQPVYAFKPCAPELIPEFSTIEKMAERYVKEMRALQPKGPYRIGGYCFGGNVAFEMARLVEAQGEKVSLLALLNAWPANAGHDKLRWSLPSALRFGANLFYWGTRWWRWPKQTRARFLHWKLSTLKKKARQRIDGRSSEPAVGTHIDLYVDLTDIPSDERKLWEAHLKALRAFHPQPYNGRVTLLRTSGYPFFSSFDRAHGWHEFARGGVEVRFVPGMHETLMMQPYVQGVARELKRHLDAEWPAAEADAKAQTPPLFSGSPLQKASVGGAS